MSEGAAAPFARRVQGYLRRTALRGRDTERIGPFVLTVDRDDALRFLSYAIPPAAAAALPALRAACLARARLPRVEYVAEANSRLAAVLAADGLLLESELPLLTCAPSGLATPEGA